VDGLRLGVLLQSGPRRLDVRTKTGTRCSFRISLLPRQNHLCDIPMNPATPLLCVLFVVYSCPNVVSDQPFKLDHPQTQIRGITGPLTYDFLSELVHVSSLKIYDSRITKIESGAICASPNLRTIELSFAGNSDAPVLTKDAFKQCRHQLEQLFLKFDFDSPSGVEEDALEDLIELRTLSLECQQLGHLKKDFLRVNGEALTQLVLVGCHIYKIDSNVFEELDNLEGVEISFNQNLTSLPEDLFVNTPKLERLILKYNKLRSLSWNEFQGLVVLEYLDLTGNRIANFDAQKCSKFMPNLRMLEIRRNLLPCKLKEAFARRLKDNLNHDVTVLYSIGSCKEM
jgi:Leucine-rich repeat (LRR) protein